MCLGTEQDASVYAQLLSHVQLFATAWTVAHQASLSMVTPLLDLSNNLPKGPLLNLLTTVPLTLLRMRVGHSVL